MKRDLYILKSLDFSLLKKVCVFLFSFFAYGIIFATDYYWTGATDNDFFTVTNWQDNMGAVPSVPPNSGDDIYFYNTKYSSPLTVIISSNFTAGKIVFSGSGSLQIGSGSTFSSNLLEFSNSISGSGDININFMGSGNFSCTNIKIINNSTLNANSLKVTASCAFNAGNIFIDNTGNFSVSNSANAVAGTIKFQGDSNAVPSEISIAGNLECTTIDTDLSSGTVKLTNNATAIKILTGGKLKVTGDILNQISIDNKGLLEAEGKISVYSLINNSLGQIQGGNVIINPISSNASIIGNTAIGKTVFSSITYEPSSTGTIELKNSVKSNTITITADTEIFANIETSGTQNFGKFTLIGNTFLSVTTEDTQINISGAVDGNFSLVLSGKAKTIFSSPVGSVTALQDFTTDGETDFQSSFKQNQTNSFNITSKTTTVSAAAFVAGNLNVASGAEFIQIGANSSSTPQSVASINNNGEVKWDSSEAGGTLLLGGVSGTNSKDIVFNKKNVTITANSDIAGIFYDLIIPTGITIKNISRICVRRNLTFQNGSGYIHNSKLLVLGKIIKGSENYSSESGTTADNNASPLNLGIVELSEQNTTKTFSTPIKIQTLKINDNTSSGTIVFSGKISADFVENANGNGSAITILDDCEIQNAATFNTSGILTLGDNSTDKCEFKNGLTRNSGVTKLYGTVETTNSLISFSTDLELTGDSLLTAGTGSVSLGGQTILKNDSTLSIGNGTSDSGNINLAVVLTSAANTGSVIIKNTSGDAVFAENIGSNLDNIKKVAFTKNGGNVRFAASKYIYTNLLTGSLGAYNVYLESEKLNVLQDIKIECSGNIYSQGEISSAGGEIHLKGKIILTDNAKYSVLNSKNIIIDNSIDGTISKGEGLTLSAEIGNISLNAAVGITVPLKFLHIGTKQTTSFTVPQINGVETLKITTCGPVLQSGTIHGGGLYIKTLAADGFAPITLFDSANDFDKVIFATLSSDGTSAVDSGISYCDTDGFILADDTSFLAGYEKDGSSLVSKGVFTLSGGADVTQSGEIRGSGSLLLLGNAAFNLNDNDNNISKLAVSCAGRVSIVNAVDLEINQIVSHHSSSVSADGITITSALKDFSISNNGELTVNKSISVSTGNISIDSKTNDTNLAASVNINSNGGNINFKSPLLLAGGSSGNTVSTNNAGDVVFEKIVKGTTAKTDKLNVSTVTGNITFSDIAGASGVYIGNISANAANIYLYKNIYADSLTFTATNIYAGHSSVTNVVFTSVSTQSFTGEFKLLSNVSLNSSENNGNISFSGKIDGSYTFALDAGTGNISFADSIGTSNALKSISIKSNLIDNNGSIIKTTGRQVYNGDFKFSENLSVHSGNGDISFEEKLDGKTTAKVLNIDSGSGKITFKGSVGSLIPILSMSIQKSGDLTFNSTLKVQDSFSQVNSCTGNTVFGGSSSIKASSTVGSANLKGIGYSFFGSFTTTDSTNGSVSIENSGTLYSGEDADFTLSSGSFTQTGTGLNQFAGGIITTGSGSISFSSDVYLFGGGGSDSAMTLNGGTGGILIGNGTKDFHIAASGTKTIYLNSKIVCSNFVLYGGKLSFSSANVRALKDIVLLNGNSASMNADPASSVSNLFAYNSSVPARTASASSSLSVLPSQFPDGTVLSHTVYEGSIDGTTLNAGILYAGENFYNNGVDLSATSVWKLYLKDNENALNAFAECYNASIDYAEVLCITSGGFVWLAAAEGCTDGGHNINSSDGKTGISFSRPLLLSDNQAISKDLAGSANLSGTYTVYDDVIRVEFVDSIDFLFGTKTSLKIENSNNEISTAVSEIKFWNGSVFSSFSGAYTDADCTISTDGKGDLSVFFLKSNSTWKTDAAGTSSGNMQSTDRKGNNSISAIPCLNIPKALSSLYASLRDNKKNRIAHYYSSTISLLSENANEGAAYTAVKDRAAPVLVAAYSGQETHTSPEGTASVSNFDQDLQKPYDAHNFIEFQYSEAVDIGSLLHNGGDLNVRVQTSFLNSTSSGGSIETDGNGLLVTGYAKIASGSLSTGNRLLKSADSTVSSLYRKFSTAAGTPASNQTHRVRIGVASFVAGVISVNSKTYYDWLGCIYSAQTPSGIVKSSSNSFIKDISVNTIRLESWDEANLTQNHKLPVITMNSSALLSGNFYGNWDTTAPVFAKYKKGGLSSDTGYEALGTSASAGTTLDRIEFHVFDNKIENSSPYNWYIKFGWSSDNGTNLYKLFSYGADVFGGARPFEENPQARTSGGIRYSSLYNNAAAFKYSLSDSAILRNFDTSRNITGGARSSVFIPDSSLKNSTRNEDGLYFSIYLAQTGLPLKTRFSVNYEKDIGYITDLAGNLLETDSVYTIDRTPPTFNMTVGAVASSSTAEGADDFRKLYLVLNKRINIGNLSIYSTDGITITTVNALEYIPKSLRFVDENFTEVTNLKVIAAEKAFINADYTGLILTLNRSITLDDIKKLYIQSYINDISLDPVSGVPAKVTYIQDEIGNYVSFKEAHAISDFAVNVVNPIYAYDNRQEDITDNYFSKQMYEKGSWAVVDWNEEQQKFGTLISERDLFIYSLLNDGKTPKSSLPVKVSAYFDVASKVTSGSASEVYNENISEVPEWRIWFPSKISNGDSVDLFVSLAKKNNDASKVSFLNIEGTGFAGSKADEMIFSLPYTASTKSMSEAGWKNGDQINFMFGLMNADGTPVKICHSPVYNPFTDTYTVDKTPLFALRLKTPGDLTSLDLWSFKLKSQSEQRGNVTILNNVIDSVKGEKCVIQVNMPENGNLNVIIMTLDGNIVKYLQHGNTTEGLHYYTWTGDTKNGKPVARGIYFVRIFGAGIDETRKIMVVK